MNEARSLFVKFKIFLKIVIRIKSTSGNEFENNLAKAYGGRLSTSLAFCDAIHAFNRFEQFRLMVQSNDLKNWYCASMWLICSVQAIQKKTLYEVVLNRLDEIIIALNTEILIPQTLPNGVIKKDRYAHLVPFIDCV